MSTTPVNISEIGVAVNAGEPDEELKTIMRENSEALRVLMEETRKGITPNRVWYSRLP